MVKIIAGVNSVQINLLLTHRGERFYMPFGIIERIRDNGVNGHFTGTLSGVGQDFVAIEYDEWPEDDVVSSDIDLIEKIIWEHSQESS